MERKAMEKLYDWKSRERRKPLIIRGARQVGKTWLMKNFGEQAYQKVVYINFENNNLMKELFDLNLDVDRILTGIELYTGQKVDPSVTLLIFDEVQEVPKALTSLKYFNENAPELHIICAGSLLGIALHAGTSFPVGKVEFLDLHPMTFFEFCKAVGSERFVELLHKGNYDMARTFRNEYIDLLKTYFFVGGMPEPVQQFSRNKDFEEVREIQNRILQSFEQDFSKHAPQETVPRIRMLWHSIPGQLTKENKKFIYGLIKDGARAREYEMALLWLVDCGLIHQVHRVTTPGLPLKAYEDLKAFKLFLVDVGLLSCMVRLPYRIMLDGNELFKEFKGALTEQYVLQQLKATEDLVPYYWTNDRGSAEIDFLVDMKDQVVPVEVKAETNRKSKSLKFYHERFRPPASVRISMADYKRDEWVLNLPLWAVEYLEKEIRLHTTVPT